MTRALVLFMTLLCTARPLAAQRHPAAQDPVGQISALVRAAITPQALEAHAWEIVRHERPSGSPGENAAIDYIVAVLAADGVPIEVHDFLAYTSDPVSARVEVLGARLAPEAITVAFSRSVRALEGPVVDVGSPAALPDFDFATGELLSLAPFDDAPDLSGAIALVDAQPRPDIAWKLERLGAAGAVFVNPEERLNELIVTSVWGTPSLRNAQRIPRLAVTQVKRSGGEAIRRLMAQGPVRVRLSTEVQQGWKPLRLAVATVSPADSAAPFVLFGGHIDGWYNAATDEGASNAAMLLLARAFHQHRAALRRGLVVAWWPGHSNGRYAGAAWFADHRFQMLKDRALAYVNVDGIGQIGAVRFGATTTASLAGLAQRVVRQGTTQAIEPSRPGRNSDMAFNGIGLPIFQIHHTRLAEDGGYWWWHTPEDTFDKVNFDILKTDTDLYAEALARMLAAPVFPLSLSAEVEALGRLLTEAQTAGGERFDLAPLRTRQQRLLGLVREVDRRLQARNPPTGGDVDLALVRVLRPVHRVVYTVAGSYHPDPAVDPGLLPGLAAIGALARAAPTSDRYGFIYGTLVRERNRALDALDEAIAETERLRERLGR